MRFTVWGAGAMALVVATGAFGAHGLKQHLSEAALNTWHTAALYHAFHGLGLLAIDRVIAGGGGRLARVAGWLMVAGLALFSGSLYALALTGIKGLGAITPIGGTAWIAAWICLALAARRVAGPADGVSTGA